MKSLYVLYDEKCELCKRLKNWILGQRPWMTLGLIPAGSEEARSKFPGLEHIAGKRDLVVVSDAGEVYLNNHAWIMCLYALEEYRDWALRLASPLLLPLAKQAFEALSRNRATISRWLQASEQEVVSELHGAGEHVCVPGTCGRDAVPAPSAVNSVRDYLQ